jgi:hypothetical protein
LQTRQNVLVGGVKDGRQQHAEKLLAKSGEIVGGHHGGGSANDQEKRTCNLHCNDEAKAAAVRVVKGCRSRRVDDDLMTAEGGRCNSWIFMLPVAGQYRYYLVPKVCLNVFLFRNHFQRLFPLSQARALFIPAQL